MHRKAMIQQEEPRGPSRRSMWRQTLPQVVIGVGIAVCLGAGIWLEAGLVRLLRVTLAAPRPTPAPAPFSMLQGLTAVCADPSVPDDAPVIQRFRKRMPPSAEGPPSLGGAWLTLHAEYSLQLGYTLLLVLPTAFLVAFAAFGLACLAEVCDARGWYWLSGATLDVFNTLPYVLWSMPALYVALTWRDYGLPYMLYLMLIFSGFGMFLMVFFLRQNRQQLRALQMTGVLDGERLSGRSDRQIFWRFFCLQFFNTTFLRQWSYAVLFIMLFDFSFYGIHKIQHPGEPMTVSAQGNVYYSRFISNTSRARLAVQKTYMQAIDPLLALELRNRPVQQLVQAMVRFPVLALQPVHRRDICQQVRREAEAEPDTKRRDRLLQLASHMVMSVEEQKALFYRALAQWHIGLNGCLFFAMFWAIFLCFDLKGWLRDGYGSF